MSRKRFSPERIITILREAEVLLIQAAPVAEVCRKLGVSEQTCFRWRAGAAVVPDGQDSDRRQPDLYGPGPSSDTACPSGPRESHGASRASSRTPRDRW